MSSLRDAVLVGCCALPIAALVFPTRAEGELVFSPVAGVELHKTLVESTAWELEGMVQKVDGNLFIDDAPPLTSSTERRIVVVDEYGPLLEGGDPEHFVRNFEEIAVTGDVEADIETTPFEFHMELSSELVDKPIRFRSDGDGGFEANFEDPGTDESLLDGLLADMDLLRILPEGGVEEGDEWELGEAGLRSLLCIGGAPKLTMDVATGVWLYIAPSDIAGLTLTGLGEAAREVDGEATVTWSQTPEEDGRLLALLEIEFEASASADLTDRLIELMETSPEEEDREDHTLETELMLEGTARVLWDLENGRAHSLELQAESEVEVKMSFLQYMPDRDVRIDAEYELLGQISLEMDVAEN